MDPPEVQVRQLVHAMGYRYRLHVSKLAGKPDLVFPKYRAIILVHGCFWHLHSACREGRIPSSNTEYWAPKLARNVDRDKRNQRALRREGWRILVLWECKIEKEKPDRLRNKIRRF